MGNNIDKFENQAPKVSMRRDLEQHDQKGKRLEESKNKILAQRQADPIEEIKETNSAGNTPKNTVEIFNEMGNKAQSFRRSMGYDEEGDLSDFAEDNYLELRVYEAVETTEKSEIARMLFNGVVQKPRNGYSKEFQKLVNFPYNYPPDTSENAAAKYDLENSSIWQVMEKAPELAEMKDKIIAGLIKSGVPPEILADMNVADFKYILYTHCAASKGMDSAKLFQEKDENGEPIFEKYDNGTYKLDSKTGKKIPICTSAKQRNIKRFISEHGEEFREILLKQPGIDKDYVDKMIEMMRTKGNTDMSTHPDFKRNPQWLNQPSFDLHHIINIKDCKLMERNGGSYVDVNDYENMCLVANGTVKEAIERKNNNDRYAPKAPTVHNTIHQADINFKNKWGKPHRGTTTDKIYRLCPKRGVRMMLGFNREDVILSKDYEQMQKNQTLANTGGARE